MLTGINTCLAAWWVFRVFILGRANFWSYVQTPTNSVYIVQPLHQCAASTLAFLDWIPGHFWNQQQTQAANITPNAAGLLRMQLSGHRLAPLGLNLFEANIFFVRIISREGANWNGVQYPMLSMVRDDPSPSANASTTGPRPLHTGCRGRHKRHRANIGWDAVVNRSVHTACRFLSAAFLSCTKGWVPLWGPPPHVNIAQCSM